MFDSCREEIAVSSMLMMIRIEGRTKRRKGGGGGNAHPLVAYMNLKQMCSLLKRKNYKTH